jgi:hypothetical protein
MSSWLPVITGFLAFLGAIAGHFVAFDLNAAAKRRDVRRSQIERLAEFISEDQTWMDNFRQIALFGDGEFQTSTEPSDKAFAIYTLYFGELTHTMEPFVTARHEYKKALREGYGARLQAAREHNQPLASTALTDAEVDAISEKYAPYYGSLLGILDAASKVAEETIPEKSLLVRWWEDKCAKVARAFSR